VPEAFWKIWLNRFQGIVTMDAHGNSLHADLAKEVEWNFTPVIN
jgi:tartrate dehydratase beta subunit/fumarate hydratase class I family protein